MAMLVFLCLACFVCVISSGIAACDPPGALGDDVTPRLLSNAPAPLTLPAPISIGSAKKATIGAYVVLMDKVVTTSQIAATDGFYVQEKDRSSGILVFPPVSSAPRTETVYHANEVVNLSGMLATNGAELYIMCDTISLTGQTHIARPLGMPNRSVGGGRFGSQAGTLFDSLHPCSCGLNNIGLLVQIWGEVGIPPIEPCIMCPYCVNDGSVYPFGPETCGVSIHTLDPPPAAGDIVAITGVVGARSPVIPIMCYGQPAVSRELRTRAVMDAGAPISNPVIVVTSPTEAEVSWETSTESSSVLDVRGIVRVFSPPGTVDDYVRGICYVPEEHKFLCADAIDQDLADIRATGANTVNLYGLFGVNDIVWNALAKTDDKGCHGTLQDHLLAGCAGDLKVIARLEWYGPDHSFSESDAQAIAAHYALTLQAFQDSWHDKLRYYLINMPLDDTTVNKNRDWFPSAATQQNYAQYLCHLIKDAHPGAPVRATLHYSVLDNLPAAPLMVAAKGEERDALDGVALVAYAGRCNSAPFTSGLALKSCGNCADPGDGPSIATDPLNVVIGTDQMDYWLAKARETNWPGGSVPVPLAMDGVGFPDRLSHWSGIVSNLDTKIQAARYLSDYLRVDERTDGFSYFMLHDKSEGTFGIVDHRRVQETGSRTSHRVVLHDLWPGSHYTICIVGDSSHTVLTFDTPFRCEETPVPWLSIETPGYGGVLLDTSATTYTVRWKSSLPEDTHIAFFADEDDRGLNQDKSIGEGIVQEGGGGSAIVTLPTSYGGYYIYGTVVVSHCSVPGSVLWDYSPGRVVRPFQQPITAQRTNATIDVEDGHPDEGDWASVAWVPFAAHAETGTTARVKCLWDADFLYAAFDVSDQNIQINPDSDFSHDSDSVSVYLWAGTPERDFTALKGFARESRQGPCVGGSSKRLGRGKTGWALTGGDTCGTATGYTIEMSIPWDEVHVVPLVGTVISADLLSVDYASPDLDKNKKWWDGDSDDWLGGAILLADD